MVTHISLIYTNKHSNQLNNTNLAGKANHIPSQPTCAGISVDEGLLFSCATTPQFAEFQNPR
jgi:hypothetical protein